MGGRGAVLGHLLTRAPCLSTPPCGPATPACTPPVCAVRRVIITSGREGGVVGVRRLQQGSLHLSVSGPLGDGPHALAAAGASLLPPRLLLLTTRRVILRRL